MIYRFKKAKPTCDELTALLGTKVFSITRGRVPTGKKIELVHEDGVVETVDVMEDGIAIEVEKGLSVSCLTELKAVFPDFIIQE
jgi:hypothetical protein